MSGRYDATPSRITRTRSGSLAPVGFLARSWRTNSVVNALLLCRRLTGLWQIEPSRIDVFGGWPRWGLLLSCRTGCRAAQSPSKPVRPATIAAADDACRRQPVTSEPVRIGWLRRPGWPRAARAAGCVAAVLIAVVGCTTVTDGHPGVDVAIAPAYRASVSASVSASAATSSIRESQRQQSLTTQAVVKVCESFSTSSKEAVDRVNDFVAAYNQGWQHLRCRAARHRRAQPQRRRGARATATARSLSSLREALNAYNDAARDVANAIRAHFATDQFNQRVESTQRRQDRSCEALPGISLSRLMCNASGYATINCIARRLSDARAARN